MNQPPPQGPLNPPPAGPAQQPPQPGYRDPAAPADPWQMTQQVIDAGKMWSYLSYASFFVGLPVFIIPLAQRDNAFALWHSRHAAVSYGLGIIAAMIITVIAIVTCGFGAILIPLCLFPWITAIHGFIIVSNGELREPILCFGLADKLFGNLTPKQGQPGSGGPTF